MKHSLHRVRLLTGGAAALGLLLLLTLPLRVASAHSADMYLQNQSLDFAAGSLQVDWRITPGPLLAGALWDAADQDKDGGVSQEEARAWIKPILSQWTVKVDGQPLGEAQLESIAWPKFLDVLQAGDEPVDVAFAFNWPGPLAGRHGVEIHNAFEEAISLNWFSLKSEPGVSFVEPAQASGSLQTDIYFQSAPSSAPTLTAWESGTPNLPGLSGTLSNLAISLANTGPGNAPSDATSPAVALSSLMRAQALTPAFLLAAFLLSLALGALHALTPGHGKTLVAAYLVGSQGRTRDAVFLGSVVTATHTGSVLLLGLITLVASRYLLPAVFIPVLELLSGLFIAGFGVHLLIRRSRALYAWYAAQHIQQRNARRRATASHVATAMPHVHEGAPHEHPDHTHAPPHSHELASVDGPHHDHSGHEHTHALPGNRVTWVSLLTLGVSGGLVPCPDAIAILLVAVAVNRIPLGMLLIVAFSLGLAGVLIAIGIAMVNGMRFLSKNDVVSHFGVYTPTLSALAVMVLGIGLTVTAASSAFFSPAGQSAVYQGLTPASAPAPAAQRFDLKKARVLYVAETGGARLQLFVRPVESGDPVQITREPSGIEGFALAPDEKSVLYETRNPTPGGGSALWAVNPDGPQGRQVLDCPQAACRGPVWSPGGQQVVYERTDYVQNSPVLLASIWRLDLKSGDTWPVFQDRQLPGFAPRFSADGRWLSYISPSSQTLQVYQLGGDKHLSLPYRTGVPEIWSPAGDAFLYWDQTATGRAHLNVYDMTTNRTTNLSDAADESDYSAAWSPDGRWVAMTRGELTTSLQGTNLEERVWLIRSDGTQARQLLGKDGEFIQDLQWSPDSRYLIYSRDANASPTEIRYIDVRTGQDTLVMAGGRQPTWLP